MGRERWRGSSSGSFNSPEICRSSSEAVIPTSQELNFRQLQYREFAGVVLYANFEFDIVCFFP